MRKIQILIALLLLLGSCSQKLFLKRKYTRGFFWERSVKRNEAAVHVLKLKTVFTEARVSLGTEVIQPAKSELFVSGSQGPLIRWKRELKKLPEQANCGDVIFYKDDRRVKCKVIEITESLVKYKTCDGTQAIRTCDIKNIRKIRFENGVEENFSAFDERKVIETKNGKSRLPGEGFGTFGWICVALGGLIAAFSSIAVGLPWLFVGLGAILLLKLRNKEEWYHRLINGLGKILGGLVIFTFILTVVLLIVFLSSI